MVASEEKQVVIPDLHGRSDLLRAVLAKNKNRTPIFLGDYINGQPFERDVLDMVKDNYDPEAGNAIIGNHELSFITVINSALAIEADKGDTDSAHIAIDMWSRSRSVGQSMLRSYGVDLKLYRQPQARLLRLYELMQERGHIDLLCGLPMKYEDVGLIAIHAGLTDEPLDKQWADLDEAKRQVLAGEIGIEPSQLYSHDLGRVRNAFEATADIVATGHTQFNEDETTRISEDGLHVRLGSNIKRESEKTIFTYLTDQAKVVPVTV